MTPIEGTMAEVKALIVNQVCAEHGEIVTCVWDPKASVAMVKCAHGEYPPRLKPVETRAQEYKRSTDVIVPVGIGQCPSRDIETGTDLTPAQIAGLREFARRYGLDADRGHVYVMRNQPYIGLDGYYYHANKTRRPYVMGSMPLSPTQKKLYDIPAGDYAWIAELEFLDTGGKVSGLGIVQAHEITDKSRRHPDNLRSPVVAEHPQLQCQKRAEWQCMRRAFPIGDEGGTTQPAYVDVRIDKPEQSPEQLAAQSEQAQKDSKELF